MKFNTVLILICLALAAAFAAHEQAERETLMNFYNATRGVYWLRNEGWANDSVHFCRWYGVSCIGEVGSKSVSQVLVSRNRLHGAIPVSFFQSLRSLFFLDVSTNPELGPLPTLLNATRLVQLKLDYSTKALQHLPRELLFVSVLYVSGANFDLQVCMRASMSRPNIPTGRAVLAYNGPASRY